MSSVSRRTSPWLVLPTLFGLTYAIAVVVVAWRAPEKGFQAFIGPRIVDIDAGGIADRAGLREGDRIVAVDGKPIGSTLDYAFRVLRRQPGGTVALRVERGPDSVPIDTTLTLGHSSPPWSSLVATLLAAMLLVLGLAARIGRAEDMAARRFYLVTAVNAVLFVGALSWTRLVVHPVLAAAFLVALFFSPPFALQLSLDFPHRRASRKWRYASYLWSGAIGIACLAGLGFAVAEYETSDRALRWCVACIALQVASIPIYSGIGLWAQIRQHRDAAGTRRAQLRWMLFGHALTALPGILGIPVMALDVDKFLLVRYQPLIIAVALMWGLGYGLAILRIRLADVDALIKSSVGYAVTAGVAIGVYVGVVLGAGWMTGALVDEAGPLPHLVAGIAAAIMFGPIRDTTTRWLDRRFFRDRRHYVEALRRAGESLALLREPGDDLAREAVEQIVAAVRAEGGALFVRQHDAWLAAHATGTVPPAPAGDRAPAPHEDGIAVPVADPRTEGQPAWLVLGPRKSGDLYSTDDQNLLAALASQLAVALANARSYGEIKTLSRTLESQNVEIRELRDKLEDENRFLRQRIEAATDGALVGDSKALRELRKTLDRVAKSDASVLLLGESGTGKGLLARLLHATSPRTDQPFMQVDCGAIAASVFESELFGHARGAFTGATRMRRGPIELAHGGTLFLDEIGELPLELQPKLLRVLEDKVVMRVGATQPVSVDVRIIAATNRNLEQMVAAGEFREDLYFRLRVVELTVPPLRERRADLPALCDSLLPRVARRAGYAVKPIAQDALARMMGYAWPGNVRELENVLERALVLGEGPEIAATDLELSERAPLIDPIADEKSQPHDAVMDEIERRRLSAALAAAEGNQSHAAKALGMPRTTFINKLRRHGLL
jgi:transcriptional regulator with GAF, ATPase, and Fis domain